MYQALYFDVIWLVSQKLVCLTLDTGPVFEIKVVPHSQLAPFGCWVHISWYLCTLFVSTFIHFIGLNTKKIRRPGCTILSPFAPSGCTK